MYAYIYIYIYIYTQHIHICIHIHTYIEKKGERLNYCLSIVVLLSITNIIISITERQA